MQFNPSHSSLLVMLLSIVTIEVAIIDLYRCPDAHLSPYCIVSIYFKPSRVARANLPASIFVPLPFSCNPSLFRSPLFQKRFQRSKILYHSPLYQLLSHRFTCAIFLILPSVAQPCIQNLYPFFLQFRSESLKQVSSLTIIIK